MRRKNFILAGFVLLSGMSSEGVCYNTQKENLLVRACVKKVVLNLFSPQKQGMEKIVVCQVNSLAFLVKCNGTVCNIIFLHNRSPFPFPFCFWKLETKDHKSISELNRLLINT